MRPKLTPKQILEQHRDWLLNEVIPGFERRNDKISVSLCQAQLAEIEAKLARLGNGKEKEHAHQSTGVHRD